jgi:hypothetical protein
MLFLRDTVFFLEQLEQRKNREREGGIRRKSGEGASDPRKSGVPGGWNSLEQPGTAWNSKGGPGFSAPRTGVEQ